MGVEPVVGNSGGSSKRHAAMVGILHTFDYELLHFS